MTEKSQVYEFEICFRKIDPGNLMPNFVKYHIVDPAVAVTKFSYKKVKKPIKKLAANIKETYDRDLASLPGELNTHLFFLNI